jgi:signal transduction histidine kinase
MDRFARLRARLDPDVVDWVIAVVFAIAVVANMLIDNSMKPVGVAIVTGVFAALALAWRRRRPLWCIAGVLVMSLIATVAGVPDNATALLGILGVAMYSVGAYARGRESIVAGVGAVLAIWVVILLGGSDSVADDLIFTMFVYGGAWLLGRAVRGRHLRALQAEDRAMLLEEDAKRAVAEERSRIARELHDVVAHGVSVMVVQAGAGRRMLDVDPERSREAFTAIEDTGRQALVEMRRLLGILRKDDEQLALAPQPSLEHVNVLLDQVREAGMPVTLRIEGRPRPLPPGIDLSAYRIVQEALTNALKHAGPASGEVVLRYRDTDLEIEIADDGRGPSRDGGGELALTGSGKGLVGMRERVAIYGGVLNAGERETGGYSLRARLPLDQERP